MIDTHSHIYDEAFDFDRPEVIRRAKEAGVEKIILPNIDSRSLPRMLELESEYPEYCAAAIGLHPTSVDENWEQELAVVESELKRRKFLAIGEIGIDLYWDKTFYQEQLLVFEQQLEWSLLYDVPVIIHMRDSFNEIMEALAPYRNKGLKGIFHSFTGNVENAEEIISLQGFLLGINGIATFKNSGLGEALARIDLKNIVLETDAPYLSPVPYRGKRNESAYIKYTCGKLAEIYGVSFAEIDRITTENAIQLFKL